MVIRGPEVHGQGRDDGAAVVLSEVLETVGRWPGGVVLAVTAIVLGLESGVVLGVLLPGSTTLVVLGVWSAAAGTPAVLPIAVATVASAGGALAGWRRGHRRRGLTEGHGPLRARIDPVVRQARAWLAAQGAGGTAVVLAGAHWVAVTRTLVPRVAGGAGVPLALVAPVLLLSGAGWVTTVVLLARAFGQRVADDASWAPAVALAALVVVLAVRSWSHRGRGEQTSTGS